MKREDLVCELKVASFLFGWYSLFMLSRLSWLVVFCLSLIWYALFMPWLGFRDPDAFYHGMSSWMLLHHGPLLHFPWLDLTTLGTHYADQHFLFHLMTALFQWPFGMETGLRVATLFCAALLVTISYGCAKAWGIRWRWIVPLLLLTQFSLVFRLELAKASALALLWFGLGMTAMVMADRRLSRWPSIWLGLIAGFGFLLSHGGWSLLLVMQVVFVGVQGIWLRWIEHRSWREIVRSSSVFVFLGTLVGIGLGWIVHPNAAELWPFLRVQLIDVAIRPPQGIALGAEWQSPGIGGVVSLMGISFLVLLAMSLLLTMYSKKEIEADRKRLVVLVGACVLVLMVLLFKSVRFVEYAAFLIAFLLALLIECIDWSLVMKGQFHVFPFKRLLSTRVVCLVIGLLSCVVLSVQGSLAFQSLHDQTQYRVVPVAAAAFLSRLPSGVRLFHASWDLFPSLFSVAPQLKFMSGLDPTFLAMQDHQLAEVLQGIREDDVPADWPEIVRGVGAEYILVEVKRTPMFVEALVASNEVERLFSQDGILIYRVLPQKVIH